MVVDGCLRLDRRQGSGAIGLPPLACCTALSVQQQHWCPHCQHHVRNGLCCLLQMKRKGWTPSEDDMAAVVTIHNTGVVGRIRG